MSGPALASANPTITPILDRLIPLPARPKSSNKSVALQMILGAVIGIGLTFFVIFKAKIANDSTLAALLGPFLYLYASLYLGVIIHETGHLVAGVVTGYRVNFIRIGPLQINPPFIVSRQPKLGIGAAGLASLFPGKSKNICASAVFMILGGPLANLISGACLLFLPRQLPTFAAWFIGVSFLLGAGNLIPFTRIGVVSDGRRILDILRKSPQCERWMAINQIGSALWNGVLPGELDPEMLRKATTLVDQWPDTVAGYVAAYSAAFDQHNDEEAARFLETALQYSPFTAFAAKETVQIEAVIFQAKRKGRIDLAEQWLADIPQKTLTPGLRGFAEAAILEARNEPEAALARLNESEQVFSRMPAGFHRDILLSSLTRRKNEIRLQASAPILS